MAKIYRQAVMAVIINNENRILIGYSPRDKSFKFPQGGLEKGENIITGIKRELIEELDYFLEDHLILKSYKEKIRYHFPPDVHPIFMGQELSIVKIKHTIRANIIPQDDEFNQLHWIYPHEIQNFNTEYRADAYYRALKICKLI
ncbi:MAG: NUDIX domain-containing protein [Bacteroidota bacterium]